ncbi:hypothetical protein V8C42DRAFT_186852 [Trichoderma barbatum]
MKAASTKHCLQLYSRVIQRIVSLEACRLTNISMLSCSSQALDRTLLNQANAQTHARDIHSGKRQPCPAERDEHCSRSSLPRRGALAHAKVLHHGIRYPCPMVWPRSRARDHSRSKHNNIRISNVLARWLKRKIA